MIKNIRVNIIGAGRVATQLAQALAAHVKIQQVYSRNLQQAQLLASQVAAQALDDLQQMLHSDLVFIAVSDSAIVELATHLAHAQCGSLVVHTSGSTSLQQLSSLGLNAGVFYPLQTFTLEQRVEWATTPLFIEAERAASLDLLEQIARCLSDNVFHYHSEQRLALHLAAVFACNFTNYCYDIAEQLLEHHKVDKHLLLPLISATANKFAYFTAFENQTGPALRQDNTILDLHLAMLQQNPEWQHLYQQLSLAIQSRHQH